MVNRFDCVKYDEESLKKQARMKLAAQKVEAAIEELETAREAYWDDVLALFPKFSANESGPLDRAIEKLNSATGPDVDEALVFLEESYAWIGKAIRDEQIERNGSAKLQEGRNNS